LLLPQYILEYAEERGATQFIETGTWYGETLFAVKVAARLADSDALARP
jgi:hypothetical protein